MVVDEAPAYYERKGTATETAGVSAGFRFPTRTGNDRDMRVGTAACLLLGGHHKES